MIKPNKGQKNSFLASKKKKGNWNQSLKSSTNSTKIPKKKKSLQYILLLKKYNNVIDYTNIKNDEKLSIVAAKILAF